MQWFLMIGLALICSSCANNGCGGRSYVISHSSEASVDNPIEAQAD